MDTLEKFLSHPILWGVCALIALSIALGGKLSVSTAGALMWAAWGLAIFGVYRTVAAAGLDFLLKILIVGAVGCSLAVGVVLVNRWYDKKESRPIALEDVPLEWNDPKDIEEGSVLTRTQLNAKSPIAGTTNYNPDFGTKLPVGTHPLTVTFVPADTQKYKTTEKIVHIVVNTAPPKSPSPKLPAPAPVSPTKDPPRFNVTVRIRQDHPQDAAVIQVTAENLSDTPSSGAHYYFAMLPPDTPFGRPSTPVFDDSISTTFEKNLPKPFPYKILHWGNIGDQIIRIRLVYQTLDDPGKPLTEDFYFRWFGIGNQFPIQRIEQTDQLDETKRYFDKYAPKQP
jgi:hypothetical protein